MGHGGDLMKSEGVQILEHIDNLSFMGFTEVFYQLPKIINIIEEISIEILLKYPMDSL